MGTGHMYNQTLPYVVRMISIALSEVIALLVVITGVFNLPEMEVITTQGKVL